MAKLIASPSSANPRCGESIKLRIDSDPAVAQLSIDALPDNGAVSVSPSSGTTNADGYAYFTVACENRGGNCDGATVTFKSTGYDSCTVSVNCHSYSSMIADLRSDDITEAVLSLAAVQGRLASFRKLADLNALALDSGRPQAIEKLFGEIFPHDLLEVDSDDDAPVIAYGSVYQQKVFILSKYRREAIQALGIEPKANRVRLPGHKDQFTIEQVDSLRGDDDGAEPLPGSTRWRLNKDCGHLFSLRFGKCRKVEWYDEESKKNIVYYLRAVQFARALCRSAADKICKETWTPYAEVRVYRNADCTDFIKKTSTYGWLCGGGPPHYY
jgi:hypothetical protein